MRRLLCIVVTAAALSAWAQSSATSGTGAAATPASSSAALQPCAVAGTCTVKVVIPNDVAAMLDRAGIAFKVFDGCPRTLGFRDNTVGTSPMINDNIMSVKSTTRMRGAVPVAQSSNQAMAIPRLSGRFATVGIFFRTDPGKYAVADFANGPDQAVKFGYMYNGRLIVDDNLVDAENRTTERHMCP